MPDTTFTNGIDNVGSTADATTRKTAGENLRKSAEVWSHPVTALATGVRPPEAAYYFVEYQQNVVI
jgi:hypothetical protein